MGRPSGFAILFVVTVVTRFSGSGRAAALPLGRSITTRVARPAEAGHYEQTVCDGGAIWTGMRLLAELSDLHGDVGCVRGGLG